MRDTSSPGKERLVQYAVERNLVNEQNPLAAFIDIAAVRTTVARLHSAFPDHFTHMFAAKANSMSRVLQLLRQQGMGCEVASPGELEAAIRAEFEPRAIVFDEPAKTPAVIRRALALGVGLNIDNFQEFDLVKEVLEEGASASVIGMRINTQVGGGSITAMSTATASAKFGVPLEDAGMRQRLLEVYGAHSWLTSLHTHVGSQGCSWELMVAGIRAIVELAEAINRNAGYQQVKVINIGGGLPVNFEDEAVAPSFADYREILARGVPELFSGHYEVKTEFGRSVMAKAGVILSRVEYAKTAGGRRIAVSHAGVQIAARTVFMPDKWPIRVTAFDRHGNRKPGEKVPQDIAGPCCFAGDILAPLRSLPLLERGDYILAHDTGAYYFSQPFYFNSLPASAVYGYYVEDDGRVEVDLLRPAQTLAQVLDVIG